MDEWEKREPIQGKEGGGKGVNMGGEEEELVRDIAEWVRCGVSWDNPGELLPSVSYVSNPLWDCIPELRNVNFDVIGEGLSGRAVKRTVGAEVLGHLVLLE
jgi:hypothetical protein